MSDFVSSLIGRSFTEQTALRPRVTSLFEPALHADVAHAEAPAARSAETPFASDIEVESETIPNAIRPTTIRNHRASQMEHSRDAIPAVPYLSQGTGTHPADDRAEDRMQEPVVGTVQHKTPSRVNQERERDFPIESAAVDEIAARSLPARAAVPAHDRELSLQVEPRPQLVIASQAIPEIVVAPKRPASQPDDPPQTRAQRRAASASPAAKANPESTINVTIGTIEVRATTENKPAPRSRSASPVMSLEDYLQRRQRGGSR